MSYRITPIERIVLESLQQEEKNIASLKNCTSLEHMILHNCINSLLAKGLINLSKSKKYYLVSSLSKEMLKMLCDKNEKREETLELLSEVISLSQNNQSLFKLKKVSISEKDSIVLKSLLHQVDSFLEKIENKKCPQNKKQIILWGEANYGKVINSYINS